MFSKHYQAELAFLRAAGKAYADANPSTAGLLADRGGDPDVERLLEGFAFLAARIRERIDDAVPEIVHDLTEMLLPHYLRSVPAATIVEMVPVPGALRGRLRVPAGAELASVPVDGTACRFRTSADLDMVPASVTDVTLDSSVSAAPVLRVQFQLAPQAVPAVFQAEGLRLHLHGEFPLASTLMLALGRHLRGVRVKATASGRTVDLPRSSVRLSGLDQELPLLPWPRMAPQGYRLLQEYFTLPQKLLFLDVKNLDAARDIAADRFELAFQLDRPPELPVRLGKETIRTNCVPAVNLFSTAGDPISVRALGEEHLVRASDVSPGHMEIYSVEAVVGVPDGPGERVHYRPFAGFAHGGLGARARYFRLRRALSPVDDGVDTFLSVTHPIDGDAGVEAQVLSFDVTATNRALPARLRLGDVSVPTATSPTQARFRNIVPVSQPVRPPLGTELHWRLLAHLAANRASVTTPEAMRALLGLYNLQILCDHQVGRANQLRVESVRDVGATVTRRLVGGAVARGTRVSLGLDEAGFAGPGDAFLFSCAVADLLAAQASLSSFVELAIRLEPSQREYAWPPRNGQKALL
jgi:type VI secretion system protein ImpG